MADAKPETADPLSHAAFMADWKLSSEAYEKTRQLEVADLVLRNGQHFTDEEWKWRKDAKKPLFTLDLLSGPCNQAANQPVPRIVVSPNGGGADPKSAGYWQGACRRVENLSGADAVYKWGRKHAIDMGRGFWRVRPDYFDQPPDSIDGLTPEQAAAVFEQDIRIEPFLHQHAVYPDPTRRLLDGSDARFCVITETLKWGQFPLKYPDAKKTTFEALKSTGDVKPDWATSEFVTVAEKYTIVVKEQPVCLLTDGTIVEKTKDSQYPKEQIKAERTIRRKSVKWQRGTAGEILETKDVPGQYIPVVEVVGERATINGQVMTRGLPRMARDPLRLVEFHESRLAEVVDLSAYDTWKAPVEATLGFEDDYVNAARDRPGLLNYHQWNPDGREIREPVHETVTPQIQGIAIAATRAEMLLRNVLGTADVQSQERREEQSGKAILARDQIRTQATNHFNDSLDAAVALTGRIIISQGREIYSAPRILRINGANEKEIPLVAYKGAQQKPQAQQMASTLNQDAQMQHMLDVGLGSFDVTITAGKGDDTVRQETREKIGAMIQFLPDQTKPKALAILIKNSDGPGMIELAEAIDPEQEQPIPPQVQQRLVMLDQFAQQATAKIKAQDEELRDQSADRDSKERIAFDNNQTKIRIEELSFDHQYKLEQLKLGHQTELLRINHGHAVGLAAADANQAEMDAATAHDRNLEMGERGHAQALEQGDISHQQALEQGEAGHAQALETQQQAADLAPEPAAGA